MRVTVDWQLCESNGFCAEVAPQVFDLRDDDNLYVLVEEPDAGQLPQVEEAVRRCPRQALKLEA